MEKVVTRYGLSGDVFFKEDTTYVKAGSKGVSFEDPRLGVFIGGVFHPTEYKEVVSKDSETGEFKKTAYRQTIVTEKLKEVYVVSPEECWLLESVSQQFPEDAVEVSEDAWNNYQKVFASTTEEFSKQTLDQQQANAERKKAVLKSLGISEEDIHLF